MMKVSNAERQAIKTVLALGEEFGYGNLMQHLATAWARCLVNHYGFDEKTARTASFLPGMPFLMQDDIMERGEWDETGERYRT
jgi:hypothetical protein